MSLYVKGELKPDICEECWFHVRWNRFEDLQCGLNDGKIIAMNTHEYKGQTAIPDWCPLVEVSEPHGRLIDENDVINAIHDRLHVLQTHKVFVKKHGDIDLLGVLPYIERINSVIEAEGE